MTEQEELQYLLANSPKALPDDPSSSGWSTSQIKEKHYKGLVILYNWIKAIRTAYIQTENIVNALNDNSTDKPLSANMGKTLKELIDSNKNSLDADISRIDDLLASNDTSLDTIQKIVNFIKNNKSLIDGLSSGKINVNAIVDDLLSTDSTKVLSAKQGKALKDLLDAEVSNRQTAVANEILARQNADELLQNNINAEIGKLTNGTTIVDKAYKDHNGNNIDSTYVKFANVINALNNTSTNQPLSAAQGKALKDMIDAINTLLSSDTTTLDTLQEVVNYIKNNKSLIDGITISKMAFTDLVKNLTTNNDNLPLSASMGYVLKAMIDAINDAENGIQAAEALRVIAEAGRVEAEEARQTGYSGFDGRITNNENDIEDLQTAVSGLENGKQDVLTFDNTPTANSNNPVKSGGIKTYIDNGVSEAKSYVDKVAKDLQWQLGTYELGVDTDTDVARVKSLPSNTIKSMVDYIGGKTVKYNQLVQNGNFVDTSGWVSGSQIESKTASNNVLTITTYASTDSTYVGQNKNFINGHKYLVLFEVKNNDNNTSPYGFFRVGTFGSTYYANNDIGTTFTKCYKLFEFVETSGTYALHVGARTSTAVALNYSIRGVEFIDLTDKLGAGNEPSDVATAIPLLKANGYKLDGTDTYSTGSLKHAITTSVVYSGNLISEQPSSTISGATYIYGNASSFTNIETIKAGTYNIKLFADSLAGAFSMWVINTDNTTSAIVIGGAVATMSTVTFPKDFKGIRMYCNTAMSNINFTISKMQLTSYIPYVAPITKAIPSEVLADVRYGLGFDNTNYNHLDLDGHLRGSWGIVDLGSLSNWQYDSTNQRWNRPILENMKVPANNSTPANVIASKYQTYSINDMAQDFKEGIGIEQSNNRIYVYTTDSANIPSGYLVYELKDSFDQDYSQYFDTNWNKVDLDKLYTTCEMVVANPIDMPNTIKYLKEVAK